MRIKKFYLHAPDNSSGVKIEELADYIKKIAPQTELNKRGDFFPLSLEKDSTLNIDNLARKITLCRVHNVNKEVESFAPLSLEIEYEKKRLTQARGLKGAIYDGFKLQNVYRDLIDAKEQTLSDCHIIFTNQLIGTFDQNDKRYHLRVGAYGFLNIISTSGIVEALAKPREYYLKQQMGKSNLSLDEEFKDQIIDHNDKRITELLKGYCAQAFFYHLTGQAFCKDKSCRLYNAHWQKDALFAQIEAHPDFCPHHTQIISQ